MTTFLLILLGLLCFIGWLLALIWFRRSQRWENSTAVWRRDYNRMREESLTHFRAQLKAESDYRRLARAIKTGEMTYQLDGMTISAWGWRPSGMDTLKQTVEELQK